MVDRCDAQTYVVAIHFTEATGVRWVRDGRGDLLDMSVEGACARAEANRLRLQANPPAPEDNAK